MSCDILTLWYEPTEGGGVTNSPSPEKSLKPCVQQTTMLGLSGRIPRQTSQAILDSSVQKIRLDDHDYLYCY